MRTRMSLVIALAVGLVSSAMAQTIHYQQNFDGLTNGDLNGQGGWAIGAPAPAVGSPVIQSTVVHGSTGKAVQVSMAQEVERDIVPRITAGIHFMSVWFRVENPTGNTLHLYLGDTVREFNAGPVIRIGTQSGDPLKVGAHNGSPVSPIADIHPGTWQHLFVVFDVDARTYSIWVDDALAAENFAWRNPAHQALGWMMIGFDAGAGLIGYYDDMIFGAGNNLPTAVSPQDRLTTTWVTLKSVDS
ncbi:MAG: hypothetical protein O3A46_06475 [Candidatus Poribacteria bacterium]|nr:hypothetical protein [Candidatus Poribacteria bacterium]